MLAFETVARLRPIDLIAPGFVDLHLSWPAGGAPTALSEPHPGVAPYLALVLDLRADLPHEAARPAAGHLALGWQASGGVRLQGWYDMRRGRVALEVTDRDGRRHHLRSRRHGAPQGPVDAIATTLTGTHLCVLTREQDRWITRSRTDLAGLWDSRDEASLSTLRTGYDWQPTTGRRAPGSGPVPVTRLRAGSFGQLGLRDLHFATTAEGEPVWHGHELVLTATHAGPGFFDAGHTGVWTFDPTSLTLTPRAKLYFRRPDRAGVYGDNATHLVRDGDRWLVATSTWGDFDRTSVAITYTRTGADLLLGSHVLDTERLKVPSDGVGVWDPHLARIDGVWHLAYVTASRFFSFWPGLARGEDLARLERVAEASSRTATEGTVLARLDGTWRVLASDGRDSADGGRRYPVFDLDLREVDRLRADYPSNIPWPNVVNAGDEWWLVTFDGTGAGGKLTGYGTHGDVLVMRQTKEGTKAGTGSAPDPLV